jgi:hypothetical protein
VLGVDSETVTCKARATITISVMAATGDESVIDSRSKVV